MITVVFRNIIVNEEINLERRKNIYIGFSGHSELNKKGSDIVCSAVSILIHTFSMTVGKILKIRQQIDRNDGLFSTSIVMNGISVEDKLKLKLLIESLIIGLTEINSEYPDKIKIEFVND